MLPQVERQAIPIRYALALSDRGAPHINMQVIPTILINPEVMLFCKAAKLSDFR
jgi:hypothetical protein